MAISIDDHTIEYGPTPLCAYSGERATFRFDIIVSNPESYRVVTGGVTVFDSSNFSVASFNKSYPPAAVVHVLLEWDGTGHTGPLPPGDYAPRFEASANGEHVMALSCTGITFETTPTAAADCERTACVADWLCAKAPVDPTRISGPDTQATAVAALTGSSLDLPTLGLPTFRLPTFELPTFRLPTMNIGA